MSGECRLWLTAAEWLDTVEIKRHTGKATPSVRRWQRRGSTSCHQDASKIGAFCVGSAGLQTRIGHRIGRQRRASWPYRRLTGLSGRRRRSGGRRSGLEPSEAGHAGD